MNNNVIIRTFNEDDWSDVAHIYAQGIKTGIATFETEVPTWKTWDQNHIREGRLAALIEPSLVGWAALSQVSFRPVYAGVAEVSIYVADSWKRKGIGKGLLNELIKVSETIGIWTLQASIMVQNMHSIRLHQNLGFREVGIRERIGKLNGVWHDTMLLERRSRRIAIN